MSIKPPEKLDLKQPFVWVATWFGSGFLRPGPGTWGSAASIPFALIIFATTGLYGLIAGIVLITALGFWSAEKFDQATEGHDNKMIVIDEAAGQWIALLPALHFNGLNLLPILFAFLLFRLFDITKPWPISWFDKKVEGAAGVMGDDIVAGSLAALILIGIHHYAG